MIKKVELKEEVYNSLKNTPIKDLNRIYHTLGLRVHIGKKGREKGLILLRNDIKEKDGSLFGSPTGIVKPLSD